MVELQPQGEHIKTHFATIIFYNITILNWIIFKYLVNDITSSII